MAEKSSKKVKRVGILTGGGDCAGLNAAIRAIVLRGKQLGISVLGFKEGWKGVMAGNYEELNEDMVSEILYEGGTILKSSRTNPIKEENGSKKVMNTFTKLNLDVLIPIGGDDTLGVAQKLPKLPMIAVPKTIDNDLQGTDFCIGFWSAVEVASQAVERLHTTAKSHNRIMILEVMGRHFGWLATYGGLAGGADYILIPEDSININKVCNDLKKRANQGKKFGVVVVSEGAKIKGKEAVRKQGTDAFGNVLLGGIGKQVASLIKEKTKIDTRVADMGHILRGGSPYAFDRILGTRFGLKAIELAFQGESNKAVVLKGDKIIAVPFSKIKGQGSVNKEVYQAAKTLFSL